MLVALQNAGNTQHLWGIAGALGCVDQTRGRAARYPPPDSRAAAGGPRLPARVHIVSLPPYSPELNPCEQLWDVLKDTEGFANGLFVSITKLRAALLPGLRRYWENAALVLSLVGRPWLHHQANSSVKS